MVVETAAPPAELVERFVATAHRIVWCTVATVDRRGRPRSRVLHPYWERTGDGDDRLDRHAPLAAQGRAPRRARPTCRARYWDATHDVAIAECRAEWVEDPEPRAHAWELFAAAEEPLGYDFHQVWPGRAGRSRLGRAAPGAVAAADRGRDDGGGSARLARARVLGPAQPGGWVLGLLAAAHR